MELTDLNFDTMVGQNGLTLVDFWAPWCGPCRTVAPVVESLAAEYDGQVSFGKLNTDENPVISQRHNVMSIPTLLLFRNGEVVDRIVGAVPRVFLDSAIQKQLRGANYTGYD